MREAVLAHSGEALASRRAFEALSAYEKDSIIEFLKALQVFAARHNDKPRNWHGSFH